MRLFLFGQKIRRRKEGMDTNANLAVRKYWIVLSEDDPLTREQETEMIRHMDNLRFRRFDGHIIVWVSNQPEQGKDV